MSGNSSATGGFLPQQNTSLSDQLLEDAVTAAIAGILNLSNSMVRPRWQALPPKTPPSPTTNWASIGITERISTDYPYIRHFNGGPDQLTRWSRVTVQVSVYGIGAEGLAEQLRDGFYISQNLEALATNGIKLTDVGPITTVPDLFNSQWINHADLEIHLAQVVNRTYNILDIADAPVTISSNDGVTSSSDVS